MFFISSMPEWHSLSWHKALLPGKHQYLRYVFLHICIFEIHNGRIGSKSTTSGFLSKAECKVDDDCTNNTYTSPPFSRPFCKPGSNNKYCGNYVFLINLAGVLSWSLWFNDSSMYKCQRGDDLCHQCQVQERHVSMPLRQTWASQGDIPIKQHWWVQ